MIVKGKIISIKHHDWGGVEIVIRQNKKANHYPMCLTAYSSFIPKINELKLKAGDVIKADYHIYSKKHNNRHYTTLYVDSLKLLEKSEADLFVDTETGEIIE